MDIDDFVFVPPDEVRREDFHEPREDDEINLVRFQLGERLFFRFRAVLPVQTNEGQLVLGGTGGEIGIISDDQLWKPVSKFKLDNLPIHKQFNYK